MAARVRPGSGPAGLALVLAPKWRRCGCGVLAGALLLHLAGPEGEPERLPPRSESAPVVVEATVAAPSRRGARRLVVPLVGLPPLLLPPSGDGPLPGARLRARGRLEAHGRAISVAGPAAIDFLSPPPPWHLGARLEELRRRLRDRLDRRLSPQAAACLKTLLLGDRSLDRDQRERLARTGLLHLFAISGLHLALLLTILRRGLGRGSRWILPVLVLYAAIADFRSPIARALILAVAEISARELRRPPRPRAHLLITITLLLAWRPEAVRAPGFLLSCSAYAGILFLAGPLLERRRRDPLRALETLRPQLRLRRQILELGLVSLAAFLGSLPVTVAWFHRIAFTAIPGSVLLAPLVPLLLVCGLALLVVPGFPPLVLAVEVAVSLFESGARMLDSLPLGSVSCPHPGAGVLAAWVLMLAALAWGIGRGRLGGRSLIVALLAATALPFIGRSAPEEITALDAGRGISVLCIDAEHSILIDTGPATARIADQLLDLGVRELDAVLVSHLQEDHDGGLPDILDRLRVAEVGHPPGPRPPTGGVPGRALSRGSSVAPRSRALRILWPPEPSASCMPLPEINDGSLVVEILTPRTTMLICGDLETRGLGALLDTGQIAPCRILVAPHHGARNEALLDLLLQCRPEEVWISARAGFPAESTMLTLYALGIPVRATWISGALR